MGFCENIQSQYAAQFLFDSLLLFIIILIIIFDLLRALQLTTFNNLSLFQLPLVPNYPPYFIAIATQMTQTHLSPAIPYVPPSTKLKHRNQRFTAHVIRPNVCDYLSQKSKTKLFTVTRYSL